MDYLTKNKSKKYKNEIKLMIENLKAELGSAWNFYYCLVGSGKRNMVIISNEGFDFDYHLVLNKYPKGKTDEEIKRAFMNAIDVIKPNHLSNCEDSTHVITIKCIENGLLKYSYDLAIVKKGEHSDILKNEKDDGSNGPYHFVQIPNSHSFFEKYSMIKGPKMWKDLRDIYFRKKEKQHKTKKENRIYSFALLQEATNDVLQKYNSIKKESN